MREKSFTEETGFYRSWLGDAVGSRVRLVSLAELTIWENMVRKSRDGLVFILMVSKFVLARYVVPR